MPVNRQSGKHILFCNCRGERINSELLKVVDSHLRELKVKTTRISDLCGIAVTSKEIIADLLKKDSDFLVLGCYRRTMDLIFRQVLDNSGNGFNYSHVNLIGLSVNEAIEELDKFCSTSHGINEYTDISEDSGWPSWYPVIDYSRCSSCGQCADFCLFGVYEKTGDRILVTNPRGCKNNCPACARICPSTAIIFPKYKSGGAVGGSDEIDDKEEQQRQAKDIDNILGGDVYEALRKRKEMRKSIIRDEAMKRAMHERDLAKNLNNKNH
ncbi:MAG: hypothetical protein HPY62_10760 [Bacteroidales bacterium]|nr:hypothetical protein [Bacteroidales bacterium]